MKRFDFLSRKYVHRGNVNFTIVAIIIKIDGIPLDVSVVKLVKLARTLRLQVIQ